MLLSSGCATLDIWTARDYQLELSQIILYFDWNYLHFQKVLHLRLSPNDYYLNFNNIKMFKVYSNNPLFFICAVIKFVCATIVVSHKSVSFHCLLFQYLEAVSS